METIDWKSYLSAERLRPSKASSTRIAYRDMRNEFESDFGRVIFSAAARRLHDKTQVVPLTSDDNIHSRLTHSIEVMNIGASLIKNICRSSEFKRIFPDSYSVIEEQANAIIQTICIIHDIGNPPFGHFGEETIAEYFKQYFAKNPKILDAKQSWIIDFTEYDGNAQGFRVITKLQCLEDLYGLNLTYASLAAYLKYPNWDKKDKTKGISFHKHGVFCADCSYAEKVLAGCMCNENQRHPLSYIMEAADSICYLSMDIEDAYNKGWIDINDIQDFLSTKVKDIKDPELKTKTQSIITKLFASTSKISRKKIVDFRVALIQYFVTLAVSNYLSNIKAVFTGKYNKELIKDDDCGIAEILGDFCHYKIFSHKDIQSIELTGHSVLNGLMDIYINLFMHNERSFRNRGKNMISKSIMRANILDYLVDAKLIKYENGRYINISDNTEINIEKLCDTFDIEQFPNYYKLRTIVDHISGMTDKFAVSPYQKLSGQRI